MLFSNFYFGIEPEVPPPLPHPRAPSGELTEHQLADDHGAIDGLLPETLEQREFAQRSGQR